MYIYIYISIYIYSPSLSDNILIRTLCDSLCTYVDFIYAFVVDVFVNESYSFYFDDMILCLYGNKNIFNIHSSADLMKHKHNYHR